MTANNGHDVGRRLPPVMAMSTEHSARVSKAHDNADRRLRNQRGALRPLGWAIILVMAGTVLTGQPGVTAGSHGIAIAACLGVFAVSLLWAISDRFLAMGMVAQGVVIMVLGGTGVALDVLAPHGATAPGSVPRCGWR
jgi:hypothetical protein